MLGNISADEISTHFSYFSSNIGFDTLCKLSPKETICMKCQILFSRKNEKMSSVFLSADFAYSMVYKS